MNKQELIDKAVRDLNGIWENVDGCNEMHGWMRLLSNGRYKTVPTGSFYGEFICTKSEFQQRAKELGYGDESSVNESLTDDWWDYDNHKPLKPAPVGEKVIIDCFDKGWKGAVVIGAFDRWNWCDIELFGLETVDLCRIKPLDHATRKEEQERIRVETSALNVLNNPEINKTIEISFALESAVRALYDAGFLKLPEQKDEK